MKAGELRMAPPAPEMSLALSVTAPEQPLNEVTLAPEAMALVTKAVVAMLVSLSPGAGVGACSLGVKVSELISAPPAADNIRALQGDDAGACPLRSSRGTPTATTAIARTPWWPNWNLLMPGLAVGR